MICFALLCSQEHGFDSWFAKSSDFETLMAGGHVVCPICGDKTIRKALMAPAIAPKTQDLPETPSAPPSLSSPSSAAERALAQMRAHLEANSDYVGLNFAAEARAMHLGEAPTRSIYGEAKADEARALLEEGIPVAPLPFLPRTKTN
jgi:hypothetical protein